MMAADNDDAYNITPAFILETVGAAKLVVEIRLDAAASRRNLCFPKESPLAHEIHEFLDWPSDRVRESLAQLNAIEDKDKTLSRDAVEMLPNQRVFRRSSG